MDGAQGASLLRNIAADDRYFLPLMSAFCLSLMLLFQEKSGHFMRDVIIPATAVYTLGASLIAQIQRMVGVRAEMNHDSRERNKVAPALYTGSPKAFFRWICAAHVLWAVMTLSFILTEYYSHQSFQLVPTVKPMAGTPAASSDMH